MAIIYSYPTVQPTADDLVLGTDVNQADKPTKNFTIQSIVDIVAGGAAGLGAVLKISSNAQDLTDPSNPVNQPIQNLSFINGTGSATFGSFTDGTMTISSGTGVNFVSIQSVDFAGNLTGIVKVGSSIAGTSDGNTSNNVTAVTQPTGTNNTTIATTAFVQQEITGEDLDFRGDSGSVIGSVDLNSETFAIVGKTVGGIKNINTDTTAGGTLLNLSLANSVTIADDLTVTDKLTVNGTTVSNIIEGGLQINNAGGAHTFNVKGQTNDNLISTNVGANDADDQVAIGKSTADSGVRLDVSGLIQGSTIKSTGLLTANADLWFKDKIGLAGGANPNYGSTGNVLTSGGASGDSTWTDITTWGFVESVSAGKGILLSGTSVDPVVNIDYEGADNAILEAATQNTIDVTADFVWFSDASVASGTVSKTLIQNLPFIPEVNGTQYTLPMFATTTTLGDSIIKQNAGATEATITGTLDITSTGTATKFIVDTNKVDADFRGVASQAKALETAGDISPVNDVISYPATSGTVKAQSGTGVAVEFQDGAGENNSIVYPVVGQVVSVASGTGVITAGTTVASVSGSTFTLSAATTTALGAGATLNFAASTLDIYTSGGNVRMPSFIPSTVATSKYLTNLPTPTSSAITATDTILSGMAKLQGQISATTGLAYEGTWAASTTAVANGAVSASTSLVITTADANLVKGTVVEGTGITGTVRIDAITGTAVTLDTAITIANGITLTMSPPGGIITGATAGTAASLTTASNKVNGHFYICNTIGKAEPNAAVPWSAASTPNEWAVGDWVIYVANGSTTDAWQKLDMTSDITGTGAAEKVALWTGTNTLGTGLISDNATVVTIGAGGTGNFTVEGETTLGGGATNNTLVSGDLKVNKELNLVEGLGLWGGSAFSYGDGTKVLTSSGAAGTPPTWETPTTGTVTEVDSGDGLITNPATGIITTGSIAIDYAGTDNAILTATAATEPILTTDQIWFNDIATLAPSTINQIKKAPISSLPFDNYAGWLLGDGTNTTSITTGATATFTGGTYITTGESSGTLTITHDATNRTSDTDSSSPAFGADIEVYDELTTNSTGHVTQTQLKTITLPSPVNFTAGSAPGATAAVGTAGYVPAPAAGTGSTGYFLNGTGVMSIPPNDKGVETVNTTSPIEGGGSSATVTVSHKAVLTDNSGNAGTYKMADVTVDGNGHITAITDGHSGGGGGTKKGGTFTKLFTSVSGGSVAFTIDRATSGAMVFDVMLTSDTSNTCSIAKKYTVVKQFGVDPVVFKIIDTGPDTTVDFTPVFAQATTDTSIKCTITPNNLNTQKIGITIDLGFGQNDATVVMN